MAVALHRRPGNLNKRQRPAAMPQRNKGKGLSNLFNLSGWLITRPACFSARPYISTGLLLRGTETRRKLALNTPGTWRHGFNEIAIDRNRRRQGNA